ncbi:MAG: hypothetical protein JO107_09710 [Hyphomicrobiales bacterium]|nr:hypothetical protein [Hyphomicrobiales bacterium]
MKRPPHHFVVEVKRQRRATNAVGKSWLDDPRFAAAAAEAVGAVGLLELEPKFEETKPATLEPASSRPAGRILPSLVEDEPVASVEIVEPRRKRERKLEAAVRPAEPALPTPAEPALLHDEPAPAVEAVAVLTEPVAKARTVRKAHKPKKPVVAAEDSMPEPAPQPRSEEAIKALAEALAARAVGEFRADAAEEDAPADRREARQARHRRILERYVRGGEGKPGQRWKLRLQKRRK